MKRIAIAFLMLFPLTASGAITSIEPDQGFVFGETLVRIHGTNLTESPIDCDHLCGADCPATVFFGAMEGRVILIRPDVALVATPAQPHGTFVTMTLLVPDRAEVAHGFTYSNEASSSRENYTQFLLPLGTSELLGANGSQWLTRGTIRNGSSYLLVPAGPTWPPFANPPQTLTVAAHETRELRAYARQGAEGAFLYVPNELVPTTDMSLRVRDVSRAEEGFGTDIPIVPTHELRKTVQLLDVPTDARYRATLRIYGASGGPFPAQVRVYADGLDDARRGDRRNAVGERHAGGSAVASVVRATRSADERGARGGSARARRSRKSG
jgi:hypothetical protein